MKNDLERPELPRPDRHARLRRARGARRAASAALLAGIVVAAVLPALAAESPEPAPYRARSAAILPGTELYSKVEYFEGLKLDEFDEFDGWTVKFELVWPLREDKQLRFSGPLRTEGEATLRKRDAPLIGQRIDVEGWGGVFDFATVLFEHHVRHVPDRLDFSYYAGMGKRIDPLDTTHADKFNHQGTALHGGIRSDHWLDGGRTRLLVNFGGRYYFISDDLNPEKQDVFVLVEATAAAIFGHGESIRPAVELIYQTVDLDFNSVLVVPEMLFRLGERFDLAIGVPIGLTSEGEQAGARLQLTSRF